MATFVCHKVNVEKSRYTKQLRQVMILPASDLLDLHIKSHAFSSASETLSDSYFLSPSTLPAHTHLLAAHMALSISPHPSFGSPCLPSPGPIVSFFPTRPYHPSGCLSARLFAISHAGDTGTKCFTKSLPRLRVTPLVLRVGEAKACPAHGAGFNPQVPFQSRRSSQASLCSVVVA